MRRSIGGPQDLKLYHELQWAQSKKLLEDRMFSEWDDLMTGTLEVVKAQLEMAWPLETDNSSAPERELMRDAIFSLQPEISVIGILADRALQRHLKDDLCLVLVYDFSSQAEVTGRWIEEMTLEDKDRFVEILGTYLQVPFALSFADNLFPEARIGGEMDSEAGKMVHFLPYNARNDPDRLASDMYAHLRWWLEATVNVPDPLAQYADRFEIETDPVLSAGTFHAPDPRSKAFVRMRGDSFSPMTMDDLADDVARIPLIPAVPQEVRSTFRRAKLLYLYGYLQYDFATLVSLVAYMALEAAIRHRWCQTLASPVTLTLPASKKKPIVTVIRKDIGYYDAVMWCRSNGRHPRELLMNANPFPATMSGLVDNLVQRGIMSRWERRQAVLGWEMRNYLAHPEAALVFPHGVALGALRKVALIINRLFDPERALSIQKEFVPKD